MMELLSFPDTAAQLGVPVNRLHQLVRDGQLIALRDGDGPRGIPASFIKDGAVVRWLPAVITMLRDARFEDAQIVEWLHRGDDSLPGAPIDALRENRGSEVKRRAQVAGY
jgi:Rv2175c C-terminal domain of unknown function